MPIAESAAAMSAALRNFMALMRSNPLRSTTRKGQRMQTIFERKLSLNRWRILHAAIGRERIDPARNPKPGSATDVAAQHLAIVAQLALDPPRLVPGQTELFAEGVLGLLS